MPPPVASSGEFASCTSLMSVMPSGSSTRYRMNSVVEEFVQTNGAASLSMRPTVS